MDIFDRIRSACAEVAAGAGQVTIDHDRIAPFAAQLQSAEPPAIADPGREALGNDEATAAFVVSLDAINFGSGYFPHLRKRPGLSGYYTVATGFREFAEAEGTITAERLKQLTTSDLASILGQPLDDPYQTELMGLFAEALTALGAHVDRHHGGSFVSLISSAGGSAAALVGELDRVPLFRDVATWRDVTVPLYKRAQIAVLDVATAFGHAGIGSFADLDRLTMFPDNLVPHVLRIEGVLTFADELVERIEAEDDIVAGSEAEVEIRACGVHAVELLVTAMQANGSDMTSGRLDGLLWHHGADPRYKRHRRHRSRTTAY